MATSFANVSVAIDLNATTPPPIPPIVCNTTLPGAVVFPGFCAYPIPIEINQARSVVSVGTDDFLALERAENAVMYYYDTDGDGLADASKLVARADRLNHGLAVREGYLYASSDSHVYRWRIADNSFLEDVADRETVVDNINRDGSGGAPFGHTTRTLAFDDEGRLYVSVGSDGNVDPDSFRSRIRRFEWGNDTSVFPLDFVEAQVFADGLRNEVGLAFDKHGDLWGVENSADKLNRKDIGGDIHEDNPAEELNRFREADAGKHWGYPWCWTEFQVPEPHGLGQGTVWAWPSFLEDEVITDEQCRADYVAPVLSLQGHSAPLGITFYQWKEPQDRPATCPPHVAFPQAMDGYAFIAYHGSWNRDVPTGYKVVYVPMNTTTGDPLEGAQPIDLLAHQPPNARWDDGFRPVDVDFDDCGRLLISSDGTRNKGWAGSRIVRMEYSYTAALSPDYTSTPPASNYSTGPKSGSPSTYNKGPAASGSPMARWNSLAFFLAMNYFAASWCNFLW